MATQRQRPTAPLAILPFRPAKPCGGAARPPWPRAPTSPVPSSAPHPGKPKTNSEMDQSSVRRWRLTLEISIAQDLLAEPDPAPAPAPADDGAAAGAELALRGGETLLSPLKVFATSCCTAAISAAAEAAPSAPPVMVRAKASTACLRTLPSRDCKAQKKCPS
jgi:hypothetical protein